MECPVRNCGGSEMVADITANALLRGGDEATVGFISDMEQDQGQHLSAAAQAYCTMFTLH